MARSRGGKKFRIAGIVLLVLIGGVALLLLNQGAALKKVIESVGPTVTGTSVTVEKTGLSLLTGHGSVRNLTVGNPEGFSENAAITAQKLDLKVKSTSLLSRHVVIEELVIESPSINYEIGLAGVNIEQIKRNIVGDDRGLLERIGSVLTEAVNGSEEKAEEKEEPGREVEITRLVIRNGEIGVGARLLGGSGAKIKVPDVELDNFTSGEGITVSQAIELVLVALIDSAVEALLNSPEALEGGGQSIMDALRKSLEGNIQVDPETEQNTKGLIEGLKGLFNQGDKGGK